MRCIRYNITSLAGYVATTVNEDRTDIYAILMQLLLDIFREHVYAYRYGLGQQQPQPFNNRY